MCGMLIAIPKRFPYLDRVMGITVRSPKDASKLAPVYPGLFKYCATQGKALSLCISDDLSINASIKVSFVKDESFWFCCIPLQRKVIFATIFVRGVRDC